MKKFFLMTFVACFAMMFVSCQKDVELIGTTWKAQENASTQITVDGRTADITVDVDCTLQFADATNCSLTSVFNGTVFLPGQEIPVPSTTDVDDFTYTFDGKKGVLKSNDPSEIGDLDFTYNKKDNSIDIDINSPSVEIHGEINYQLHFVQQ